MHEGGDRRGAPRLVGSLDLRDVGKGKGKGKESDIEGHSGGSQSARGQAQAGVAVALPLTPMSASPRSRHGARPLREERAFKWLEEDDVARDADGEVGGVANRRRKQNQSRGSKGSGAEAKAADGKIGVQGSDRRRAAAEVSCPGCLFVVLVLYSEEYKGACTVDDCGGLRLRSSAS